MLHKRAGFELDDFTLGYIVSALWSSSDDQDEPLDKNYNVEDITPETIRQMIADCRRFQANCAALLSAAFDSPDYKRANDSTPEQTAGHDFWLTRNGHGAGFWDGDYPKVEGEALTAASEKFDEVDLYVGDDGKVYA